jgi:hypothetical protein
MIIFKSKYRVRFFKYVLKYTSPVNGGTLHHTVLGTSLRHALDRTTAPNSVWNKMRNVELVARVPTPMPLLYMEGTQMFTSTIEDLIK